MGTWAIIGIVIGSIFGFFILLGCIGLCLQKCIKEEKDEDVEETPGKYLSFHENQNLDLVPRLLNIFEMQLN